MVSPGLAVDEVQHAVMGAAEAVVGEDAVGVADEVAIGEEQQLDQVVGRLARRGCRRSPADGRRVAAWVTVGSADLCQPC